jgi:hypothetical protein
MAREANRAVNRASTARVRRAASLGKVGSPDKPANSRREMLTPTERILLRTMSRKRTTVSDALPSYFGSTDFKELQPVGWGSLAFGLVSVRYKSDRSKWFFPEIKRANIKVLRVLRGIVYNRRFVCLRGEIPALG